MIGDWRGTCNVLGLLLMMFGLDAAVRMLTRVRGLPDCVLRTPRADTMPGGAITGGHWRDRPQPSSAKHSASARSP